MINRRYRLLRLLGRGGSGEVYLAEDTLSGLRHVALKVLHASEAGSDADRSQFLSEVALVSGFTHPNIVEIFDAGRIHRANDSLLVGRYFFTMEFVDGTDALTWVASLPNQDQRTHAIASLLFQSLTALEYLHGEGVTHYDIKPQNLLLTGIEHNPDSPVLKLTDFGFSHRREPESEQKRRGTLHYMAPELLRGAEGDQRIDLYSLGATFYHLIEGSPPADGSTATELVKNILQEVPVFSPTDNPLLAGLQVILTKLLQKDPADRFPSASKAVRACAQMMKEVRNEEFPISPRPSFVGRGDELAELRHAIDALTVGELTSAETSFCLSGPEGIGKSSLLQHVSRHAKGSGLAVYEFPRGDPSVPFSSALPILSQIEAEVASHSDAGERIARKYESTLSALRQPSDGISRFTADNQAVEILSRFFVEASGVLPFVLIVDDVEARDPLTVQMVTFVLRDSMPGRMLTVLSTSEPGALTLPHGLRYLPLPELSQAEVIRMAESILAGDPLGTELGEALHRSYGGVPGVLTEVLRSVGQLLAHQETIDREKPEGFLQQLPSLLPRKFDDFLVARYRSCNQDARTLLEYLSCFDSSAPIGSVLRLLPTQGQARTALNQLASDGSVIISRGGERVQIKQDRLKSVVQGLLGDVRRQRHHDIFVALEDSVDRPEFSDLVELAHQCREAGNAEVASRYFEEAAQAGVKRRAFLRASELYREAIEALPEEKPAHRVIEMQSRRTDALVQAGRFTEAALEADDLLHQNGLTPQDSARLYRARGTACLRLGRYDEARSAMIEALRAPWPKGQQLAIQQELTSVEIVTANYAKAEEACREQLVRAAHLGNRQLTASIYTNLGLVKFYQGRFDEAVLHFRAALDSYALTNQPILLADSMNNVGNALSAMGNYRAAIQYWTKALASSQEFGMLHQQGQIQNNLGIAYYNLRDFDRASEYYSHAHEIFEHIGSRSGLANALTNLAEVSLAEGEYEPALHRLEDALPLYREMDEPVGIVETSLQIAQIRLIWGDTASALIHLTDAERTLHEKDLVSYLDQLQYARGLLALKTGDISTARGSFQSAGGHFQEAGKSDQAALCVVRQAECDIREEQYAAAINRLDGLLHSPSAIPAAIAAESMYLLGTMGWKVPQQAPEKPLVYFKDGMEKLQPEPVCELTWKLSFALAREYFERGQEQRAREFLLQTKVILEFFLSHFTSSDSKARYLSEDQREQVLATIDTLL
jgi:serine/threonine protein kinase/tetratricopeptide (TPR) repeat protein